MWVWLHRLGNSSHFRLVFHWRQHSTCRIHTLEDHVCSVWHVICFSIHKISSYISLNSANEMTVPSSTTATNTVLWTMKDVRQSESCVAAERMCPMMISYLCHVRAKSNAAWKEIEDHQLHLSQCFLSAPIIPKAVSQHEPRIVM